MRKLLVMFLIIGFAANIFAQQQIDPETDEAASSNVSEQDSTVRSTTGSTYTEAADVPAATSLTNRFVWNLVTDFNTGLAIIGRPVGERKETMLTIGDSREPNIYTNNPVSGRGDYTYTPGYNDFFSYGAGTWLRGNELQLALGYKGPIVELHLLSTFDALVRPDINDGTGRPNEFAPDHSLVQTPSGVNVNWGDFLRYSLEEYYFKGSLGAFTVLIGNVDDRGKTNDFNVFTEDVLRTIKVDNFGVITPDINADFLNDGQDTNNLLRTPELRAYRIGVEGENYYDNFGWVDLPYFMIGLDIGKMLNNANLPFYLQLAADPGNNSGIATSRGHDSRSDFSYTKMNGAVRLSAEGLANLITFDLIYRFKGGDPNIMDNYTSFEFPQGVNQPDGLGIVAHTFGAYFNILNIPNFGIGFGYSGYAKVFESDAENYEYVVKKDGPFFSGIDLRVQYTGINKMTITLANNVSFASVLHSIKDETIAIGVLGFPLPTYTSEGWLAIYNALAIDYKLSKHLTASLHLGNRFGEITTQFDHPDGTQIIEKRTRLQFGGGLFAIYEFTNYFSINGGLAFRLTQDSYSNNGENAQNVSATRDASGGMFDFAIPIRARIVFGNN